MTPPKKDSKVILCVKDSNECDSQAKCYYVDEFNVEKIQSIIETLGNDSEEDTIREFITFLVKNNLMIESDKLFPRIYITEY
jgi:hypothetical protein